MAQQTAVNWYYEQTVVQGKTNYYELLEQANKMFEKQIEKAWDDGFDTGYLSPNNAEKYYNETYGK